jgi:hypothetical protein
MLLLRQKLICNVIGLQENAGKSFRRISPKICNHRFLAMQDRLPKSADEPPIKCEGGNFFRVCYSSHSSLTELQTFVRYLQPKKVFPCDGPKDTKYEEVREAALGRLGDYSSVLRYLNWGIF